MNLELFVNVEITASKSEHESIIKLLKQLEEQEEQYDKGIKCFYLDNVFVLVGNKRVSLTDNNLEYIIVQLNDDISKLIISFEGPYGSYDKSPEKVGVFELIAKAAPNCEFSAVMEGGTSYEDYYFAVSYKKGKLLIINKANK